MNGQSKEAPDFSPSTTGKRLAVGLVATETNTDALLRAVVRAQWHGYECIVALAEEQRAETGELLEAIGADVIVPDVQETSVDLFRDHLIQIARERSYPGIILAPTDCNRIDYERTETALDTTTRFSVDAIVHHPFPETHPIRTMVAIPAYNEAGTIRDVVHNASSYADTVVVIDDGSDDDTANVARDAGATVVTHEENGGYGSSLKTAFREAMKRDAEHLVVLDGDGQHDAADIPQLVDELEYNGADVVIGSRFADGATSDLPRYRWVGLKVINGLTNLSMGVLRSRSWVRDTQSGFRAYSSPAIQSLARDDSIGDQMDASTDILYHAHEHDYDIEEVGTTITYEVENASSHNPVKHGLTLLNNVLQTIEKERPVMIFGIPGLIFTLIGVGLVYWAITDYVATETLPIGIAIAAVFSSFAGILACFTAIILHSLTMHFRDVALTRNYGSQRERIE